MAPKSRFSVLSAEHRYEFKYEAPPKEGSPFGGVFESMLANPTIDDAGLWGLHAQDPRLVSLSALPLVRRGVLEKYAALVRRSVLQRRRTDADDPSTPGTIATTRQVIDELRQQNVRHPDVVPLGLLDELLTRRIDPDVRRLDDECEAKCVVRVKDDELEVEDTDLGVTLSLIPHYYDVRNLSRDVIPILHAVLRTVSGTPSGRRLSELHRDRLKHSKEVLVTLAARGLTFTSMKNYLLDEHNMMHTQALPWNDARYKNYSPLTALRLYSAERLLGEGPRHMRSR
jgi:hypothetical protein